MILLNYTWGDDIPTVRQSYGRYNIYWTEKLTLNWSVVFCSNITTWPIVLTMRHIHWYKPVPPFKNQFIKNHYLSGICEGPQNELCKFIKMEYTIIGNKQKGILRNVLSALTIGTNTILAVKTMIQIEIRYQFNINSNNHCLYTRLDYLNG